MKIIDNKKDYYDYLSGTFGIDETVVYDRRGSVALNSEYAFQQGMNFFFSEPPLPWDKPLNNKEWCSLCSIIKQKEAMSIVYKKRKNTVWYEGEVYHFILEVGTVLYRFEEERWIEENDRGHANVEYRLIDTLKDQRKYSDAPMSLIPCQGRYGRITQNSRWEETKEPWLHRIDNPIIVGTFIPKVIPAADIWQSLYAYLSSLKDIPFTDTRSDIQRLESAGFDKKTSFRNVL